MNNKNKKVNQSVSTTPVVGKDSNNGADKNIKDNKKQTPKKGSKPQRR